MISGDDNEEDEKVLHLHKYVSKAYDAQGVDDDDAFSSMFSCSSSSCS